MQQRIPSGPLYRIAACLLLPYFVLMSLNTADVGSGSDRVSNADESSISVLECIEQTSMDLDTDARDSDEQDTASKSKTIGDAVVDVDSDALLPYQPHHTMPPHRTVWLLEPIVTPAVPPPDCAPQT